MTDQNTSNAAEVVKRVAAAIHSRIESIGVYFGRGETRSIATDAIHAHTTYLWDRAMQPDVVEAVALTEYGTRDGFYEERPAVRERYLQPAREQIYAALTLLLGPRPEGDTDAD